MKTAQKPKYGMVVDALRDLNNALCFGILNALTASEIRHDPQLSKAMKASLKAEYILRRAYAVRPPRRPKLAAA